MSRVVVALGAVLAGALVACSEPFVLFPGGALEGPTAAAPPSWAFLDEIDTIQLEARPEDPYSVNIWVVALDEHPYVHAGAHRATWVEAMEADPRVRLKADGAIYALAAERVTSQAEFDRFSDAYEAKYGRRPRNEDVGEAYLFRLAPRPDDV